MAPKQEDAHLNERFYANPWARQTSSEMPPTEAFTDSIAGTPFVDHVQGTTPVAYRMAEQQNERREIPTRPGSSGLSSNSGLEIIGKDVKKMMDAIQRLRHLGFETSVVPLPKIVVVGDQSTGKSSVIEGISGIKVPRNVGTCTRCPLEINLSNSDAPWHCKMFLSRRFMYGPDQFGPSISKVRPFGPWEPLNSPEDYEFASMDSKDSVADALLAAQLATLNPGLNYQAFQPANSNGYPSSAQVDFSPNVVRLDISGPGLPNLAFYDLPGMISHVGEEKQNAMPKLVENLVREYIKPSNTIILLTLTMNYDIQNSKAAGFISKIKSDDGTRPDDRTVGVFTKPDLITPDSEDLFVNIFRGTDFRRKLGYFVVKNNHDPRVDHTTARSEEVQFFSDWDTEYPRLRRYKDRMGTPRLQEELSRLLADQIRHSLPMIRESVHDNMSELEGKLSRLPKPPMGNLSLEIASNVSALARGLEDVFKDNSGSSFLVNFQKLSRDFRQHLVTSHPRFYPSTRGTLEETSRDPDTPVPSRRTAEYILLDDDEEDHPMTSPQPRGGHRSPNKRRHGEANIRHAQKRPRVGPTSRDVPPSDTKMFSMQELRELIVSKDDTGLPGPKNPLVTKEVFAQSITHWPARMQSYLSEVIGLLGKTIMARVDSAFKRQLNTPLHQEVVREVRTFVRSTFDEGAQFARRCLRMEKGVYTLDHEVIEPAQKAALEEMQRDRRVERVHQQIEEEERNGKSINDTAKAQRITSARAGVSVGQGTDEFEMAINQMATIRGYYQYAATRYAEYVALCLRTEVFTKCADNICPQLTYLLHLQDEDANTHIRRLLEVSPDVANERARCEEHISMLRRGLEQLQDLEEGRTSSEDQSTQSTIL